MTLRIFYVHTVERSLKASCDSVILGGPSPRWFEKSPESFCFGPQVEWVHHGPPPRHCGVESWTVGVSILQTQRPELENLP